MQYVTSYMICGMVASILMCVIFTWALWPVLLKMKDGTLLLCMVAGVTGIWVTTTLVPLLFIPPESGIWLLNYPMSRILYDLVFTHTSLPMWVIKLMITMINGGVFGVMIGVCIVLVRRLCK